MVKNVKQIFGEVDYETTEIDAGILDLVKEINKFDNIRTFGCCEGDKKVFGYKAYVILASYSIRALNDFFKVCQDTCWKPRYGSEVKWEIFMYANHADNWYYKYDNDLLVVCMETLHKEETPQLIAELTQALHEYNSQGGA